MRGPLSFPVLTTNPLSGALQTDPTGFPHSPCVSSSSVKNASSRCSRVPPRTNIKTGWDLNHERIHTFPMSPNFLFKTFFFLWNAPEKHRWSRSTSTVRGQAASLWPWDHMMRRHFTSVAFLPRTITPNFLMFSRGKPQTNPRWGTPRRTVKVTKNKERLRSCHSRSLKTLSVTWDPGWGPGTGKGHQAKLRACDWRIDVS